MGERHGQELNPAAAPAPTFSKAAAPPPRPQRGTRVITRKVPTHCPICENGVRDVGGRRIDCDACAGKGWLWITENVTEQS
jgi:hypothetical protein